MQEGDRLMQKEFISNLNFVLPIVQEYFNHTVNKETILNMINFHRATENLLDYETTLIKYFLELCGEKWLNELSYMDEILLLKDQILDEMSEFSQTFPENGIFRDFINNESFLLIDLVFNLTQVDAKQNVGYFCKGLVNGFEAEALQNFEEIFYIVLWKNLMRPYPIGLVQFIQKGFEKIKNNLDENALKKTFMEIQNFVTDYLKTEVIQIENFQSADQLENHLCVLANKRKICHLYGELFDKYSIIINKYQQTCIEDTHALGNIINFKQENAAVLYSQLEFTTRVKRHEISCIFQKISKGIKILKLSFNASECASLKKNYKSILQLIFLKEIHLDFKNNLLKDKGLALLLNALTHAQSLTKLTLDLRGAKNKITNIGVKSLANFFTHSTNITTLCLLLSLGRNLIDEYGIELLMSSIQNLKKLLSLYVCFKGKNRSITNRALKKIKASLTYIASLREIILDLRDTWVTNKTIHLLGSIIKTGTYNKIFHLNIVDYSPHDHGNDKSLGMLAKILISTQSITILKLNFMYGKKSRPQSMARLAIMEFKNLQTALKI